MGERKIQICVSVSEHILRMMEKVRNKTNMPISQQIVLKLKGFWIWNINKKCWIDEEND